MISARVGESSLLSLPRAELFVYVNKDQDWQPSLIVAKLREQWNPLREQERRRDCRPSRKRYILTCDGQGIEDKRALVSSTRPAGRNKVLHARHLAGDCKRPP